MKKPKGKSWRRSNPRDVLKRIIAETPNAGNRKVFVMATFLKEIYGRDGKDALDSVAEYWFEANWDRLKGGNHA